MKIIKIEDMVFTEYPVILINIENTEVETCEQSIVYDLHGNRLESHKPYCLNAFLVIRATEDSCVGNWEKYVL